MFVVAIEDKYRSPWGMISFENDFASFDDYSDALEYAKFLLKEHPDKSVIVYELVPRAISKPCPQMIEI